MLSLKEYVAEAIKNHKAIGHFNTCTIDGFWAIADAARDLNLPVIVGVSEGERDYIGARQISAIVKTVREERQQPIFLNADHTYSFERVREAIDLGFDAVIFDGATLSLEENIAITKQCRDYADKSGKDVLVEGELGFIGTSSKVLTDIPKGAAVTREQMTRPADAKVFVEKTGVDMLAPAVGNIHGVIVGGDPSLNSDLVKAISSEVNIPLVLHGASGNSAGDIEQCIKAGVAIVHVNTELRLAYRTGLVRSLSENPDEVAPYKYLKPAKLAMKKVVEEKLKIFNQ